MQETLSQPISLSQMLSGRFPLLATLAGWFWIGSGALHFGQAFGIEGPVPFHQNAIGLLLGDGSLFSRWLSTPIHLGANVATGLALVAFSERLPAYREAQRRAGVGFALVGALAGVVGLAPLLPERVLTDYSVLYSIALLLWTMGGQILSIAALLIGFGAWRVHNPPERWAARCIALFGVFTLSLAPLLYMAAFTPGSGGPYGPVTVFVVLDGFKAEGSKLLSGLLWFAAARLIVVYDKTLRSPEQAATRTTA